MLDAVRVGGGLLVLLAAGCSCGGLLSAGDGSTDWADERPCVSACGAGCCTNGEVCVGGADCAIDLGACTTSDDCTNDSYCEPALARCVPYGVPPAHQSDPGCTRIIIAGTFAPSVQCEFGAAPAGDAWPAHLHVLSTPMVVDFAIDRLPDAPARPSIVAVFDDGVDGSSELPTGVLRILDGATCAQTAELGTLQLVSHSSPPAVGDLDGDGRAEIVAYKAGGGLVAFRHDAGARAWTVQWRSTQADGVTPYDPTGGGWSGPSLYDLDDDGIPEVLRGGFVFDAAGRLIDGALGILPFSQGQFAVVADVDDDGRAELVASNGVWQWDAALGVWSAEPWSPVTQPAGHVALADFGAFAGSLGWPATAPEVAVVSTGAARVQTLDGQVVFGPIAIPGGGRGGPPTIADFDGDGRPEFATAGAANYVVFDLDCSASPIGDCASGRTDGILWARPSQDLSSNMTGSSVFDFEGDGRAEAVYGDECFLRVYDGTSGTVVFSQYRSSCTWYENPVIADVDGDFNAEIVIGNNFNCGSATSGVACSGLEPGAIDPLFAGLGCAGGADCLSGVCDGGLCRCASDADCCGPAGCATTGTVCALPPAGTPGTGSTCRASHPQGALGIRVYQDVADRWVRSRMIWNQHAYHVTNVDDSGSIPRTSAAMQNWRTAGLNNFRQNVQGDAAPGATADVTAGGVGVECAPSGWTLSARVCNRGTDPVGSGIGIAFYEGAALLCRGESTGVLDPGRCETVRCTGTQNLDRVTVTAVADDGAAVGECREMNNTAAANLTCVGIL